MIYILTGPIRSGKTTALLNWSASRNDVDGLLCPDGNDGKRYFLNIQSKASFEFEVKSSYKISEDNDGIVVIGHFKFLKSAFERANNLLKTIASETKQQYIIIDELGKLELKHQGLHDAAEILIPKFINTVNQHLILVVREYLLEDMVEHYDISDYKILRKKDLESVL